MSIIVIKYSKALLGYLYGIRRREVAIYIYIHGLHFQILERDGYIYKKSL